jgi:hypothetical protein
MCSRSNEPGGHDLLRRALPGFFFFVLLNSACFAINDVGGSLITLNDNGGWSWFEDERAIVDPNAGSAGKIILSSVGNASGIGGATRNADVEVTSYDLATSAIARFTLANNLQADDHDSAALLKLPDGRYLSSYSKHSSDSIVHWRISTSPGSASAWGPESTYSETGGTTYSNLAYLSASGEGFVFDRVGGANGGV